MSIMIILVVYPYPRHYIKKIGGGGGGGLKAEKKVLNKCSVTAQLIESAYNYK